MNKSTVPLFGHNQRTRFLIGVAMHGPIRARELGRILSIDPSRLPGFVRDFITHGIVVRGTDMMLSLDESFFAFEELAVLLNAMGGRRVVALPDQTQSKAAAKTSLFWNAHVTSILVALSMLRTSNIADLALVSGVDERTTPYTVRRLKAWGIVTAEWVGADRHVRFNEQHHLFAALDALLKRLAAAYKPMANRANAQRQLLTERARFGAPEERADIALPFGTPLQQRALIALARHESLTTATLATAIGTSQSTARTIALELAEYGLVVCTTIGSGPQRKRWIALNGTHPLISAIKNYVAACSPGTLPPPSVVPLPPRSFRPSKPVTSTSLPGHPIRTAVLTATFDAGEIDVPSVGKRLGRHDWKPIRRWAEELAADGLIDYGPVNGKMTLRVKTGVPGASELRALVRKMVWFTSRA